MNLTDRLCDICDSEFTPNHKGNSVCSESCLSILGDRIHKMVKLDRLEKAKMGSSL